MANDMRLDLNFVDHPKVKRLIRVAGHEGFYGLIRLFSMAGKMCIRDRLIGSVLLACLLLGLACIVTYALVWLSIKAVAC